MNKNTKNTIITIVLVALIGIILYKVLFAFILPIILFVVLVAAGPLAEQIPKALLAGILLKVGLDIVDWRFLLRAHKLSLKTAAVMFGVLLMTVF